MVAMWIFVFFAGIFNYRWMEKGSDHRAAISFSFETVPLRARPFLNLSGVGGWRGMGIGVMGAWILSVRRFGTPLTMC